MLAQQTGLAPWDRHADPRAWPTTATGDNWDGYVAEREALVDWLVARATPNPVVITGDSH